MQKLRQESSTPTIKSLSPRPETKISYLRSPRLPTIGATQKISKKLLTEKTDSPVNILGSRTGKLKESPREKKKIIKTRFTMDEIAPVKISGSQSILEESMQDWTLITLRSEIENLKGRLEARVRNKQTKKIKYHQNVLISIEKSLKIDSSLESLYPSITSTDDSSYDDRERFSIQILTETIANIQNDLVKTQELLKRKEITDGFIRKERKEDLNGLSNENSNLKALIQELSRKIDKLKSDKAKLKQQCLQIKTESQELTERTGSALNELKLDLQEKNQECDQLKDLLFRNENSKKRLTESMKDLETNMIKNRNDYLKVEQQYELLKQKHQNLIEQLMTVEEKAKKYETTMRKLENQSVSIISLEQKHSEDTDIIKKLNKTLSRLERTFEVHRLEWRIKEENYQKSIQELLNQVENERVNAEKQVAETLKLKRNLSLRDSEESLSGFVRDEISRYASRLLQAETESTNNAIEVEKLRKTLNYYKDLIKNKDEIISQLEACSTPFKCEQEDKEIKEYEGKDQEIKECELRDALILVKAHLMCQNCSMEKSKILISPCGNYICQECKPQHNICPVCMEKYSNCTQCSLFESLDNLSLKLQTILL
jgi:myosin heavy subunit